MATINIDEAIRQLATLIERARSGEEIVIADGTGNAVRLAPVGEHHADNPSYRGRGLLKGKVRVSDEDLFERYPTMKRHVGGARRSEPAVGYSRPNLVVP